MKYVLITLLGLLIIFVLFSYVLFKKYKKSRKEYKELSERFNGLSEEFQKVLEADKIKENNKEKADEKISNLHNGNVVDNAIDILRKH